MAQRFKVLVAFTEDLALVPSPSVEAHSCLSFPFLEIQHPLLFSVGIACMWYRHVRAGEALPKTLIHGIKNSFFTKDTFSIFFMRLIH